VIKPIETQYTANTINEPLSRYFNNQRIERYPEIAATIKPGINTRMDCVQSGIDIRSQKARSPAASMIGIDIKKENLAAPSRSKFRNIPPVIVDPEREIPGNTASA
jgi:hypothetical protein